MKIKGFTLCEWAVLVVHLTEQKLVSISAAVLHTSSNQAHVSSTTRECYQRYTYIWAVPMLYVQYVMYNMTGRIKMNAFTQKKHGTWLWWVLQKYTKENCYCQESFATWTTQWRQYSTNSVEQKTPNLSLVFPLIYQPCFSSRELLPQKRPLIREETACWPSQNLFNQFKTWTSFHNYWKDSSALTHVTHPFNNRKSISSRVTLSPLGLGYIKSKTLSEIDALLVQTYQNAQYWAGKQLLASSTNFSTHCKCCTPLGAPRYTKRSNRDISPGSLSLLHLGHPCYG